VFFEENNLITNSHKAKTESEGEALEQYLLTISRSGSFIANEVAEWVLDPGPKEPETGVHSDEDDDDVDHSRSSFWENLKIVWSRKVQ